MSDCRRAEKHPNVRSTNKIKKQKQKIIQLRSETMLPAFKYRKRPNVSESFISISFSKINIKHRYCLYMESRDEICRKKTR